MGAWTMKVSYSLLLAAAMFGSISLAACTQTGPVEFSAGGADAGTMSRADDMDFGPMDHSVATCKAVAQKAGAGQCVKVRAYESCMKTRGYITLLGPENPSGCGEPVWEQDVRKWIQ
jgi:predicted small lipoprotein YifL